MTLAETIFTIKNVLSRFNISDDNRINERSLISMVNAHAAAAKLKFFATYRRIDPIWLQDMCKISFTRVTSSDDPDIKNSSVCLGKFTIPPVISFTQHDAGVYRISSSSKLTACYPIDVNEFYFLLELNDNRLIKFPHYMKQFNAIYVHPYQEEGSAILVLENPLDGYVKLTENIPSGNLTIGDTFIVMFGNITYNSIVYSQGSTFVCTQAAGTTFTGNGIVQYNNKKRSMTIYDNYPMSKIMETDVIMSILNNEFKIEEKSIADIINDARDEAQRISQARYTK